MSGINWDVVNEQCKRKSSDFAKAHPNFTVEAAYYAGYMECAGERESLRCIVNRMQAQKAAEPTVEAAPRKVEMSPILAAPYGLPENQIPASLTGSFM